MRRKISATEAAAIITDISGKKMSLRQIQSEFKQEHIKGEKFSGRWMAELNDVLKYKRRHPGRQSIKEKPQK